MQLEGGEEECTEMATSREPEGAGIKPSSQSAPASPRRKSLKEIVQAQLDKCDVHLLVENCGIDFEDYDCKDDLEAKELARSATLDKLSWEHGSISSKFDTTMRAAEIDSSIKKSSLGKSLERFEFKVFSWILKKAEAGDRSMQFAVACHYDKGINGVEQDLKLALKWYIRAAERGHKIAQNNLGVLFESGILGEPNKEAAACWYTLSARHGFAPAQFHVGLLHLQAKTDKDYREAFQWFKRAGKQGHRKAISNVGSMYLQGLGVQADYKKAFKWLKKAAKKNCALAWHNIAVMYGKGLYVDFSVSKSKKLMERSLRAQEQNAKMKISEEVRSALQIVRYE